MNHRDESVERALTEISTIFGVPSLGSRHEAVRMVLNELYGAKASRLDDEYADYDLINVDVAEPTFGAQIGKTLVKTHGASSCRGPLGENGMPICCIHNPSDHHMLAWPQNWRGDKGMMERLCPHGIGHPDPDDLKVRTTEWAGVHGCDGCCFREPKVGSTRSEG